MAGQVGHEVGHDADRADTGAAAFCCVVILTIYAALFEPLGFVLASLIFGMAMARLYEGTWIASVVSGVVLAIGLYLLFDKVLDVPLPLGILSALEI